MDCGRARERPMFRDPARASSTTHGSRWATPAGRLGRRRPPVDGVAVGEVVPKVGNRAMSSQLCNGLAAGESLSTSPRDPIRNLGTLSPACLRRFLRSMPRRSRSSTLAGAGFNARVGRNPTGISGHMRRNRPCLCEDRSHSPKTSRYFIFGARHRKSLIDGIASVSAVLKGVGLGAARPRSRRKQMYGGWSRPRAR